jgi:hypothetical protein
MRLIAAAATLVLSFVALAEPGGAQDNPSPGRLSNAGVLRATAIVDSIFVARTKSDGRIDGGDWASYLLARLGAGPVPDTLGVEVVIDTSHVEVRARLRDLPAETRALVGPLAAMVDSNTLVVADITFERTGREVARFWLRGIKINGFPFPEFLLASMMASVGRQYPALTASGRDLYLQVPADGQIALGDGVVILGVTAESSAAKPRPPGSAR